ncbi:MAG: TatD family hydrolase [Lachnospiraceae bacterium]|nr:TatD family hydrolase [Lachnospiraceae bacterium]
MKIFETHAHYDDEAFDKDREELINSFCDNNIYAVTNIGADLAGCRATMELIKKYDFFYGAIGIHPSDVEDLESFKDDEKALSILRDMALSHERVVAIGEIGLDYHYDDTDKILQEKWFVKQLDLARELNLPVVIHSRDAAMDTIDIMKREKSEDIGGVIHCYSYSKEIAKIFLDMGFYIGVGGVLTFKNSKKLKETVAYAPLERIVLETDSPYLAPEPYRGKRNSSLNIPYVAEELANIKGVSVEEVYEVTWNNALKLYNISDDCETSK